jgi:hypothetical protein
VHHFFERVSRVLSDRRIFFVVPERGLFWTRLETYSAVMRSAAA